jgi:hypothetical protein
VEIKEANEIIATFMGWYRPCVSEIPNAWNDKDGFRVHKWFSESLDLLVPVWRRLKLHSVNLEFYHMCVTIFPTMDSGDLESFDCNHGPIQHAACIATAKVILALNEVSE